MSAPGRWGPPMQVPGPGYVHPTGAYAPPQRSDSTRTLAVVALVVSVICLAAVLLTQLLPMLMFGLIGFGVGGPFSDGDPFAAGSVGGFTGTVYDGSVTVNADGLVEAAALGAAVTSAMRGGEILGTVTCDPVPKAAADVTTLCRGDEFDLHSYAVIRFTSDTGRFQAMTFIYD